MCYCFVATVRPASPHPPPLSATPALSMLLSVFSHHSPLHLAINMYVLHSFSGSLIQMVGAGDFLTLLVGGGTFTFLRFTACLNGCSMKLFIGKRHIHPPPLCVPFLIVTGVFASFFSLLRKAARRSPVPSLGASGGVCAVLGAFSMLYPQGRLCIPFLVDVVPHSFPARDAVWALVGLELVCAVFLASRSPIDHAAHLGGLLFGM